MFKYVIIILIKQATSAKEDVKSLTLTQMLGDKQEKLSTDEAKPQVVVVAGPCSSLSACSVRARPLTVLHPLRGTNDSFGLIRTLEELQPRYVILYDADMIFVRQLEVRFAHTIL